jgi:hypothetical protein
VVHASTAFTVTLASRGGSLLLTVRDDSHDLPAYPRRSVLARGGRGLRLVEAHSAAWGTSPEVEGGKSVWASFDGGAQASTDRTTGKGSGRPRSSSPSPIPPARGREHDGQLDGSSSESRVDASS